MGRWVREFHTIIIQHNHAWHILSFFLLAYLFIEDRKIFLTTWKELPSTNEVQKELSYPILDRESAKTKLETNSIFVIAERSVGEMDKQV